MITGAHSIVEPSDRATWAAGLLVAVYVLITVIPIALFGWTFLVVLAGTIRFLVVSHFPE